MLLIFFGQIGTGKSTIAREIAKKLNYEFINFDNVMWLAVNKKKMYGDNDEFLLSMEETQKVYDSMHVLAKFLLQQGKNVVLESMYFKKQRGEAIQVAKDINHDYKLIEIVCDEEEVKRRVNERKKKDPQTPGFDLYLQYRNLLEKEDSEHIILDTTNKTIEESTKELVNEFNF